MQHQLHQLQQWSEKNNMILNPSKCHVMFTSFQRVQPTPPTFNIGESSINPTTCLKPLGIHVQQNLKWDT